MRSILTILCLASCLHAAERDADHAALRTLLETMTSALNQRDFTTFSGHLAPGFRITFADQRTFTTVEALAAYQRELTTTMGITAAVFAPEPDGPAVFISDTTGICSGRSVDSFTSEAGTIAIPSRWTATVVRDQGGTWRLATFHSGVNLLDNPVLDRARSGLIRLVWIAGLAGLAIGGLAAFLLGRRARA